MIVDLHAHVVMPDASYRAMATLVASRANPVEAAKLPAIETNPRLRAERARRAAARSRCGSPSRPGAGRRP